MHFPPAALTLLTLTLTPLPLHASAIPAAAPALLPRDLSDHGITPFPFSDTDIDSIQNVFSTLEAVPDDILKGDDSALEAWVKAHAAAPPTPAPNKLAIREPDTAAAAELEARDAPLWIQITKCAFEIGKAIAENVFPAAKLRRLVELVKFLGGARKVAKLLLKAKSLRELIIIGGPELQELAEILLGISDVAQACFTLF